MSDHFSTYKDIFKLVSRANDDIEVFETIFREYANSGALIKTTGLASAALHLAKLSILNVDVERASSKIRVVNKEL